MAFLIKAVFLVLFTVSPALAGRVQKNIEKVLQEDLEMISLNTDIAQDLVKDEDLDKVYHYVNMVDKDVADGKLDGKKKGEEKDEQEKKENKPESETDGKNKEGLSTDAEKTHMADEENKTRGQEETEGAEGNTVNRNNKVDNNTEGSFTEDKKADKTDNEKNKNAEKEQHDQHSKKDREDESMEEFSTEDEKTDKADEQKKNKDEKEKKGNIAMMMLEMGSNETAIEAAQSTKVWHGILGAFLVLLVGCLLAAFSVFSDILSAFLPPDVRHMPSH